MPTAPTGDGHPGQVPEGKRKPKAKTHDDSEHNTQELRYYSDDGAESELGEPEGHGRSRSDAASRGESRHYEIDRKCQ